MRTKWIRLCAVYILTAGLMTTVAGCRQPEVSVDTTVTGTSPHSVIGFAMDTLVIERWENDRNVFVSTIGELGGEVIVQNANSDSGEQENQIRYLLKKNVDVLVIVAIDEAQLSDEIQLAEERGVQVIAYDRMIHQPGVDLYVSFDNTEVGRLMAQAMIREKPSGQYFLMNGSAADRNSAMIRDGIREVLASHPECTLAAEATADNWSSDDAYAKFKVLFGEQTELDGIFCSNDALAGAAVRALALYRQAGRIAVTGQDADLDACQRIVEGTQLMTVYKPIGTLAKAAAEAAMAMANGDTPDANDTIALNGVAIPFNRIAPIAVDRANLLEIIIDSGFHSLKDVYRNIPIDKWPTQTSTSQTPSSVLS